MTEAEIIAGCKREERAAQKALFDKYSPTMFGVCKRYVKNKEDAEDVMVEGLYKAMANIDTYQGGGSFEGWIRRIVVNESLMFLRKKHSFGAEEELNPNMDIDTGFSIEQELAARDILALLDRLPTGYRTVFNLFVIEGFKHREIADMLGISINTSKSQLILAKDRLQTLFNQQNTPNRNHHE